MRAIALRGPSWLAVLACTVLVAAGPSLAQENADEPGYQEKAEALDQAVRDNAAEASRLAGRAAESEGDYARILSRRAEASGSRGRSTATSSPSRIDSW